MQAPVVTITRQEYQQQQLYYKPIAQQAQSTGLVQAPEQVIEERPDIVVRDIGHAAQETQADDMYQRLFGLAQSGDLQKFREFLRSKEFNQLLLASRRAYYDRLLDLLSEKVEQLPEAKRYGGNLHFNANALDAWQERFNIVHRYQAEREQNPHALPRLVALKDEETWAELNEQSDRLHQLGQHLNDLWYLVAERDPPQLTDQEIEDIGERIYHLHAEAYTQRTDLLKALDAATRAAIVYYVPKGGGRVPQNMSELLRMYRASTGEAPTGRAGLIEDNLIHLYDITATKEKARLRNEEQFYQERGQEAPTAYQLLNQAQNYIVHAFDRRTGERTRRRLLELRHQELEEASGVSRDLLMQSQSLECLVCGFERFVKHEFTDLYQTKLFRCSDNTTVLKTLCGDEADPARLQSKLSGFERYGAMYEDERLLQIQEEQQRYREERAAPYVEHKAEPLSKLEENKLRAQELKLERQKAREEEVFAQQQLDMERKAQEQEEDALIDRLDHLREQEVKLLQTQSTNSHVSREKQLAEWWSIWQSALSEQITDLKLPDKKSITPQAIALLIQDYQESEANLQFQLLERANTLVNEWQERVANSKRTRNRGVLDLQRRFVKLYENATRESVPLEISDVHALATQIQEAYAIALSTRMQP